MKKTFILFSIIIMLAVSAVAVNAEEDKALNGLKECIDIAFDKYSNDPTKYESFVKKWCFLGAMLDKLSIEVKCKRKCCLKTEKTGTILGLSIPLISGKRCKRDPKNFVELDSAKKSKISQKHLKKFNICQVILNTANPKEGFVDCSVKVTNPRTKKSKTFDIMYDVCETDKLKDAGMTEEKAVGWDYKRKTFVYPLKYPKCLEKVTDKWKKEEDEKEAALSGDKVGLLKPVAEKIPRKTRGEASYNLECMRVLCKIKGTANLITTRENIKKHYSVKKSENVVMRTPGRTGSATYATTKHEKFKFFNDNNLQKYCDNFKEAIEEFEGKTANSKGIAYCKSYHGSYWDNEMDGYKKCKIIRPKIPDCPEKVVSMKSKNKKEALPEFPLVTIPIIIAIALLGFVFVRKRYR